MESLGITSVFYSDQNIDLAYNLKHHAREVGINVNYAFTVYELAKQLNEHMNCVVFIDSDTINVNDNVLQFIKSYPNSKNPMIVCITKNKENNNKSPETLKEIDHIICSKQLYDEIRSIKNDIRHNHYLKLTQNYNLADINVFLSDFLLSIGISTKHIGFTFIKQCIEYFLNNNGIVKSLNTHVYPMVASRNNTQAHCVERNIRNSIHSACKFNPTLKNEYSYLFKNNAISNRVFLCFLFDKVLNKFSY